jgi:hypothetical protein
MLDRFESLSHNTFEAIMTHTEDESVRAALYSEVNSRGNKPVAHELGIHGPTLISYLAKLNRPGTAALVEQRFLARGREIAGETSPREAFHTTRRRKPG